MSFEEKNGIFEVKLNNGDVVRFDSEEEMRAAKEYDESIKELLGHVVERPKAVEVSGEKKKVRITIDPDVEFVGARDTSSDAQNARHLPLEGKAKRFSNRCQEFLFKKIQRRKENEDHKKYRP